MVVAAGVEGEFADEFSSVSFDDSDLESVDEDDDAGSGAGSAEPDVVHASGVAEADAAVGVDGVVSDAG